MPRPVCITYDSTCDLTPQLLERFHIRTIPLTIQSGGRVFPDDGNYTSAELYADYRRNGTLPKTTAISPEAFKAFFSPLLVEGYDIVHIDISSELSCTCQNAVLAAQELTGQGQIHVPPALHRRRVAGTTGDQATGQRYDGGGHRRGAAPPDTLQRHQLRTGHTGVYVEGRPLQRRDGAGRQYAEAEALS